MKILTTHTTEDGLTWREMAIKAGIAFELVREMDVAFGSNTETKVYTYNRPSDSARRWVIESSRFAHPDIAWTETFVVDAAPTDREVTRIIDGKPVA